MKQSYKCEVCEDVFTGENAKEEIIEHLMECAVIEYRANTEVESLIQEIKTNLNNIKDIDYRKGDYDTYDYLKIMKEDGSYYYVYLSESFSIENILEVIENKENLIKEVIEEANRLLPDVKVRFYKEVQNTGYAGNGLEFHASRGKNGIIKPITAYRDYQEVDLIVGMIRSHMEDKIEGRIEVKYISGNPILIDNVPIQKWMSSHVGKKCRIEIVD